MGKKTTGDLRIRVSQEQKDRIKNNAEALGYKNISDYTRSILLNHDLDTKMKINEILKYIRELAEAVPEGEKEKCLEKNKKKRKNK